MTGFRFCGIFLPLFVSISISAQELYPPDLKQGRWHGELREIRYHPDGGDFVITNGNRRFTRAIYGTNTAFRIEAGDLPEFALYMPGMGGTLKLALQTESAAVWLINAKTIIARYRPGTMIYDIRDPLLGAGDLHLEILALADEEGLIIKTKFSNVNGPVSLIWAFGGASGKKFSRDGDMGPDPESSFYLKPENCAGNQFTIAGNEFKLRYGKDKVLYGAFPKHAILKLGDANAQADPRKLYSSAAGSAPVLTGKIVPANGTDYFFVIKNPADTNKSAGADQQIFAAAELARKKIAGQIRIITPDPYLNTLGGALSIASNAIWESPSYLHGSIGWRIRLNGWRGPYTADPLGWHDRAREHFRAYALSQLKAPGSGPNVPDTALNLARQQEKLGNSIYTSGYISREPIGKSLRPHHYDMNLVFIDALLWHLNWTGDIAFAREMWPVLQRHLAWEKRNFDPDNDGLYDAYAAIWASDALQYSGGAVTHSSAYNYRANKKAAEIAVLIGADPNPFRREAEKILKALNTTLWMPSKGWFAEYRDLLGRKSLHPAPGLWTIYHAVDSDVPDAFQAWQSMRYVDKEIPHIPIIASGLDNGFYTLSTTNWMPYEWSLNNVALAESMHTALANWEAGRPEEAFRLFKSELIASMYLGGSPGNFVQISHYDAVRGEAYRDFGDPVGISSRAVIEGLFGIVPDALHNRLTIRPGMPASWNYASLKTPDISYDFKRTWFTDTYTINPRFTKPLKLEFIVSAIRDRVKSAVVNGKSVKWTYVANAIGAPQLKLNLPAAASYKIRLIWEGSKPSELAPGKSYALGEIMTIPAEKATILKIYDPQGALNSMKIDAKKVTGRVAGEKGGRTVFVQLKQGQFTWWYPVCIDIKEQISYTVRPDSVAGPGNFIIHLHDNTHSGLKGRIWSPGLEYDHDIVNSQLIFDKNRNTSISVKSQETGITRLFFRSENTTTPIDVVDWTYVGRKYDPARTPFVSIDLSGSFNDRVTNIFRKQYFTPRAKYPTLALPVQGMGEWTHPLLQDTIDDSGLRKLAGEKNYLVLPQQIPFKTPEAVEKDNIVFVSQWDRYPREATIPMSGTADRAYLLVTGSTNPMQSRIENGEIVVTYTDGSFERLALRNPENWWPIEQDYFNDGFAFNTKDARPVRIHLKTGRIVISDPENRYNGKRIDGGAATVLELILNPDKPLKSMTVRALANDVVIGLMSVTLRRNPWIVVLTPKSSVKISETD